MNFRLVSNVEFAQMILDRKYMDRKSIAFRFLKNVDRKLPNPTKNSGKTDDEMRQIRFNYWIVTTAIKLSIAAFAFRMLYLQRKKVRI